LEALLSELFFLSIKIAFRIYKYKKMVKIY